MLQAIDILEVVLPLIYAGVFAVYLRHFLQPQDSAKRPFRGTQLLYGTIALHVGYLSFRSVVFHHFPVSSRAEFLSLVALCVAVVYAFAETRHRQPGTGVFFISIALLFQFLSALLIEPVTTHPLLHENPIYGIHVIFMVLGFTALAISALYALMYLLLARQLKSRDLGVIFRRLPPLSTLENMSRLATVSGIVLLGVGLALGHYMALYVFESFNFFDPKVLITDIAWLAYLLGYIVVRVRGLSGRRMGYLSLACYLVFVASMVVVNTFSTTFHSFQ